MKSRFLIAVVIAVIFLSNTEPTKASGAAQVVINMLLLEGEDTRISKQLSMTWRSPVQREDDSSLSVSDIDYYQVRYRKLGDQQYRFVIINPPQLDASLILRGEVDDQYELSIRVVDTAGLASGYTNSIAVTFNTQD